MFDATKTRAKIQQDGTQECIGIAMRILQVAHLFLPQNSAGTEMYCYRLSKAMAIRHEVILFFSQTSLADKNYNVRRFRYDGLECRAIVNNLMYEHFHESFDNPAVDRQFEGLVDDLQPNIIHVHHLMFLSFGILRIANDRKIPLVMTLHDHWLFCPRWGQLLMADGAPCLGPEPSRCAVMCQQHENRTGAIGTICHQDSSGGPRHCQG